jgi:hypothetical protein
LIELRADGLDTLPRSAVRFAVLRANEAPLPQAQENVERAVRQDMTLAGETGDRAYLAVIRPFMVDGATKGEFVQNTLFVL